MSTIRLFLIILFLVIIDTSTLEITPYIITNTKYFNMIIFTVMVAVGGYCHYRMLKLIKQKINVTGKKSQNLHIANTVVPLISISLLILICIEMYISLAYHSLVVKGVIWISYGLGITNLVVLSYYFFRWFRFNKNYLIISYFISIIMITVNLGTALIAVTEEQLNITRIITSTYDKVASSSGVYDTLNYFYDITSVLSFVLLWVSSILLLIHYAKKYGLIVFGFLMLLPMVYFLATFSPLFSKYFLDLSFDYPVQSQVLHTFILTSGKPIGGFLFGLVFWLTSKNISSKQLAEYLRIAGCGIMLLFTSNQVMYLSTIGYPPFGTITVSFLSLASYLLFIGLYTSSICVAQDKELRHILRKSKDRQQNLMNQIGTAHIDQTLITTTKNLMNKMEQDSGVKIIEEDNYQKYIQEVLSEIKKEKMSKNEK